MTITVMPGESQSDLEALQETIRAQWTPSSDHENFLVDQMISARWRLERLARWEQEAINRSLEKTGDVLAELESRNSIFDKLERYTRAAERAYSKAVKELQQHRANQAKTAKQNEATEKRNKKKEAEEWLRAGLAAIDLRDIPDPMAGLWDRSDSSSGAGPLACAGRPAPQTAPPLRTGSSTQTAAAAASSPEC